MAERKFRQHILKRGDAAKIRDEVAQEMRENIIQARPKAVDPVDYETYVSKNKTILHNDPQREMLTFPYDDIVIPPPTPPKKMRTLHSTVPPTATQEATNLLVRECIKSYTDSCHVVKYKYEQYSGGYQKLLKLKTPETLPEHVFEIDAEVEEKEKDEDTISRQMGDVVTKEGWLYKGPESGKENVISFTRQFKKRYFVLKQQADMTYILEFFKDEKMIEAKGSIFLELAEEAIKNPKKGKYSFEIKMQGRGPYVLSAESESEASDWIKTINRIINLAETASQLSMEQAKEEPTLDKAAKVEYSMHPELQKYSRETESMVTSARAKDRQNLFKVYPNLNRHCITEDTDSEDEEDIDVFPREFGERFLLGLVDFKTKLQINQLDENIGKQSKSSNPEPFFLTFALYDAKDGRKISEDFHIDPNDPEILGMIPPEVLLAADKLQSVEGKKTSPPLNGLDENWLKSKKRQGIFSVVSCHSEVYLVITVEKVLQGPIGPAIETYIKALEGKNGTKQYKQMKQFCSHIGHHRMPFAWAACQVLSREYGPRSLSLYRYDGNKISEDDLIKHLQDFRKPEKQSKLQEIPGSIKISLKMLKSEEMLQKKWLSGTGTLTSSFIPIKPFPNPPVEPPAFEVDEFVPEKASLCDTYDSYINNLYVYPCSLKFEHQKSFTKARNIACCIELRDSDSDSAVALKYIYGRPEVGIFTSVSSTTVIHHSTSPDFNEEVKIILPIQIHDRHHILFKFYHVSCEGSKSGVRSSTSGKKRDNIESAVGTTWLPLLHQGKVVNGEMSIPVASNLPPGYLSYKILEPGRGSVPDIKWVDGAKQIFKVKVHVRSTVYTTDQHLHNFFFHCQKLENSDSGADSEIVNKLKSLHAIDCNVYVKFLPTLLNQLFNLLSKSLGEDISFNTVKVLIHIVSEVHEADKVDALKNYVKYVFKPDPLRKGTKQKAVHEELSQFLTSLLRPGTGDHVVTTKFLKHSWFFFQILVKSMTIYLVDSDRVKMPRNERFTSDYQFRIQTLLQTVTPHIIQKQKDRDTKLANQSIASFLKMCFTLMDRGFVFEMISKYIQNFGPGDAKTLFEFKYEFLTRVCSHEHYIPLSLPMMRKGMIKTFKGTFVVEYLKCDYTLSDEYRKNHYLAGLLLHELKMALNEPRDIRRIAILMLRNQLAKHAFDDRYTSKSQQGRIAALYLPIISILMEHKRHLVDEPGNPKVVAPPPPQPIHMMNGDGPVQRRENSRPGTPQTSHKSVTFDNNTPIRDSKVFALIAGSTGTPTLSLPDGQGLNGSTGSLTRSGTSSDEDTGKDKKHKRSPSSSNVSNTGAAIPTGYLYKYQKLDIVEIKDLLLCFISVIKHLPEDILLGWFNNSSEFDIIDFFGILETCLHHFKYQGRKKIHDLSIIGDSRKALTMPASRRSMPALIPGSGSMNTRTYSQYSDLNSESGTLPSHVPSQTSSSEADALVKALQEANMSTEVGLAVLDILSLYCNFFKKNLEYKDGDNSLMQRVFDLHLYFLQHSQSETLQKHVFAALRQFIRKFENVLYRGNAKLCGDLCYEILRSCNSKLYSTRKEACALLYLLMRQNFEHTKKKSVIRVHLQVIISVNKLIGNVVGLSNSHLQESLAMINSYASSDRQMQIDRKSKKKKVKSEKSGFPAEVKDLTKKIRTVLMATAQMKEHEKDPEMLIDLQYSLAKSYDSTPELRKTWLDSMAKIHLKHGNYSEEAHCFIHIAALIAEYLKRRGKLKSRCFPQGCAAFKLISPNVEKEESGIKDDSGMQDVQYTEETMVEYLEKASRSLEFAERYEMLGEIYKLVIPIYEFNRDYERLSSCYTSLSQAYTKAGEVVQSGKRLLGKYFRVGFYGSYFDDEDQKEYIYKEPKVTSLPEICERISNIYGEKYGKEIIKLIQDSKKVDPNQLDGRYCHIQVTHVTPYFDERELQRRLTDYERNNNIRKFMFETPFTKDGKAHGEIDKQYKRRTVLTTTHSFPYVKKRIDIIERKDLELSPIEVAIDQMQTKVAEMKEVVNMSHPDLKRLQLKLQGSVSAQVNAGPLAFAEAFISKGKNFPESKVELLKEVFRDFVYVCNDAVDLNGTLVTTEQKEYHESLNQGFQDIVSKLNDMFGEKILKIDGGGTLSRQGSQAVLNINSSSAGASLA
ncbi:dedicator of cytokinesis protein 9-like isoform X5 [Mytilus trossulus]|uniref:dedicator of cytokinesis protein 9-like isoform X5 n=1 Tax=Mytilus trossulus TaxID=6551 RepID=UPI0030072F2D